MSTIIGSFYLMRNETGDLTGEYTNNVLCTVSTEHAALKEAGPDLYEGKYLSSWLEAGEPHTGELVIGRIANENSRYHVIWNDNDTGVVYEAEAFLADGVLVGHYVSLS